MVLVVGFVLALISSVTQPWFKQLLRNKVVWLIAGYGVLTVVLALLKPTDTDAEILGVVYNTRFLLFFLYAVLLVQLFPVKQVRKGALTAVLASAAVVLLFGIVQYTVLPNTALEHVGYQRSNGVFPAFFIDDKPDLERVMSTLRDPNSLGSYIIIIGILALGYLLQSKNKQVKKVAAGLLGLSVLCLWFTFSRSALLGFVLSAGVLVALQLKDNAFLRRNIRALAFACVAIAIVGLVAVYSFRNTYFVQNVVFHADQSTVLEDPNQLRARFWRESIQETLDNPLGNGPGTAGLASIRNNVQGTVLNENYYFQLAHEVGLLGLGLFLAIVAWVGLCLYKTSTRSILAAALLAALAGLMLTNFLVHIWSNEAVAYTWWGLAGLVFFAPELKARNTRRA